MNCPRCGSDVTEKDVCSKCNEKINDSRQGIEVHYKEFKQSELLEISQKKDKEGQGRTKRALSEDKGKDPGERQGAAVPHVRPRSDPKKALPVDRRGVYQDRSVAPGNRILYYAFGAVIVLMAAIAVLFFLRFR
ncbi:MAG: hypothetical protein HZA17_11185 [Nitrospirae bacterium]|nr:hypothetical protein [Nitrospirota bacterium]